VVLGIASTACVTAATGVKSRLPIAAGPCSSGAWAQGFQLVTTDENVRSPTRQSVYPERSPEGVKAVAQAFGVVQ
jgi:hypothetical protein